MNLTGCSSRYRKYILPLVIILPLLAVFILSTPVLAAPLITLSPTSGAMGTEVTITGTNFDSYKGDSIAITFDTVEIPSSPLTVPDTGTFTVMFTIPAGTEAGRHWFEVTTTTGTIAVLAKSFFIIENAEITLDIADGIVGTDVIVNGTGFSAGYTVTVYYHNVIGEKLGTVVASDTGTFSYPFTIPLSTAGEHKIMAENAAGNVAETSFEVIPSVTLNHSSGSPGSLLKVSGTGFGFRSQVSIDFGIYTVASARTDEYGSFSVEFNIPQVNAAVYNVKAEDALGNLDKAPFNTIAGASLSQSIGSVGDKLTINGIGFKAGAPITIDFDDLRVATASADNNGVFAAAFSIPVKESGDHVVKVSDGVTTKLFTFSIESEAPPVPELLLPDTDSETRAEAYLDWQDVTDTSMPVIYSLQLATDRNFSGIVIEKYKLVDSEYTLSEDEWLDAGSAPVSYYWRVKATDSAGNESEWAAASFIVSAPPAPELIQESAESEYEDTVFLNWQDVASLSPPINYTLQIASDLNFTTAVLEKTALSDSEYFLSEEEELELFTKDEPYYWRVKAIDSAYNESEWATPASFTIIAPFKWPGWATYVLIGIGVIIIVYLAFRYGRRTAFEAPG